ncbi:isoamyl acetate-hydrolyzing esterase [Dermatophagoides pteronyssinus]|uniref:Isoamyl acetate-hydrolyzing esterase n=1 Tax=Dermatophagoides pteronyssinus TaxID=6956 RepID=A0ABQ8IYQ7_DERPT|nr:isoamyl acetate-hydrolyzing esterase [Dermatophagoides pteronyssinus]
MIKNTLKMWPKIILFGDSHTQRSFDPNNGCWGALLANKFQRVCDIVPRGFSGYNTRWCKMIMPKIFAQFKAEEIACVTILLGSNDSVPASSVTGQHVPVDEYRKNLVAMLNHLTSKGIDKDKIILITPPHMHQTIFKAWSFEQNRPIIPETWEKDLIKYVDACRSVAKEMNISLLDLYKIFMAVKDNNEKLFNDGLHLSRDGGQLLYDNLLPLITERVVRITGKPLTDQSMQYPYWRDVDVNNPEKSLLRP